MGDALYAVAPLRRFAGLSSLQSIPDEMKIPSFRHLIEECDLAQEIFGGVGRLLQRQGLIFEEGAMVDAQVSTKNDEGRRDPGRRRTKKCNNDFFGMTVRNGADADSGLTHSVVPAAANESDVAQVAELPRGEVTSVHGDARYAGGRAYVARPKRVWVIAKRPSEVERIANARERFRALRSEERKARVRLIPEHPSRRACSATVTRGSNAR